MTKLKKFGLPSTVKVGPYTYKVTERDRAWCSHTASYGQCNEKHQTIDICTEELSDICIVDTFIHEILHCIWHVANLADIDVEEKCVTLLSTGLTGVLVDNPEVVKLLAVVMKTETKE